MSAWTLSKCLLKGIEGPSCVFVDPAPGLGGIRLGRRGVRTRTRRGSCPLAFSALPSAPHPAWEVKIKPKGRETSWQSDGKLLKRGRR